MSKLILLIGIPGSGKSYLVQQILSEFPEFYLISTDHIRAKLFGKEEIQGPWLKIWAEIQNQLQQAISEQKTILYDATNASRKQRREIIELAKNTGITHITGLWLDTPLSLCLERNQQRQRQVPQEIIQQMAVRLNDCPPSLEDGLDRILRYTPDGLSTEIPIPAPATTEPEQPFRFYRLKL
ncbi:MAG TPA: AAA family ATPase [Halomicronema sp.]